MPNLFLSPAHPSINACGYIPCGLTADGQCTSGKITSITADEVTDGGVQRFLISWSSVINAGWVDATRQALYIFDNGTYVDKISGGVWEFVPNSPDNTDHELEFFLAPVESKWEAFPHVREKNLKNSVLLDWDTGTDDVEKVEIYKSTESNDASTIDTDNPFQTLTAVVLESTSSNVTVQGKWNLRGWEKTATISGEFTVAGGLGVAVCEFTYDTYSEQIVIQDYPQHVFNGLSVSFADTTYTAGSTFSIYSRIPSEKILKKIPNGTWYFKAASFNASGLRNLMDTSTGITVSTIPSEPSIASSETYSDGSGEVTLNILIPGDVGINTLYVRQNHPGLGIDQVLWPVIYEDTVSPGQLVPVLVKNLTEGRNLITASVSNDGEFEYTMNGNSTYEIELDASLNQIAPPHKPFAITARVTTDPDIEFTITANSNPDTFRVYKNDGEGGDIDYGTVWKTVTNTITSNSGTITVSDSFLPDGTAYLLGVRSVSAAGVEEENTDIVLASPLVVNTISATPITNLTATLVS